VDDTITTIYCLCDEFLKAIDHRDDPQVRLTTAEVMTVPLVAAAFFGGNIDKTRRFLHEYGYMPTMISKSHLNRRIHAIEPSPWWALFSLLAEAFKKPSNNPEQTYVVDSLCPYQCATTSASAAAGSTLRRTTEERFEATSPANDATSTVCGCIW
jgi:hypothetical protein